jgi:hypothetical protein
MHNGSLLPYRRRRPELSGGNDLHAGRRRHAIGQMCVEHLRNRPDRMRLPHVVCRDLQRIGKRSGDRR